MEAQTCPWLALGASLVTEEYREIPSTPHPPTPHTQSLWRCPFSPLSALFPAVHTKPSTSVFFFLFFHPSSLFSFTPWTPHMNTHPLPVFISLVYSLMVCSSNKAVLGRVDWALKRVSWEGAWRVCCFCCDGPSSWTKKAAVVHAIDERWWETEAGEMLGCFIFIFVSLLQ